LSAFGGLFFAPFFFLRLHGKRFFLLVWLCHSYFLRPFFLLAALQQFLFLWFSLLGLFSCSYSRFFALFFGVLFFVFSGGFWCCFKPAKIP